MVRALQHLQLVREREDLEVQHRARANQRTDRNEYGDDDGHHPSKAIRPRRDDFVARHEATLLDALSQAYASAG
jgi:hypothetical protein